MVTVEYWPTGWSCCGMSDVAFRNDVLGCLRCLDSLIDAVILCKGRTGLTSTCELSWISSALHLRAPVCQLFDTLQSINTLFQHVASKSLVSSIKIRTCMEDLGCLPFVKINRLGRTMNTGKGFSKITKPTERNGAYHLQFDFP